MDCPPLAVIKTSVRLPIDIIARIQALAGPRGMSEFVREALLEKLERQTGDQTTPILEQRGSRDSR